MERVEKTVFICYRRTNFPWAKAIAQDLIQNGYDVFLDFTSIPSGDFESVILENVRARAHFLVVLTPSALERVNEPGDWLRREIETAMDSKRNIIPLLVDRFDFGEQRKHLAGKLANLEGYAGLNVYDEYFDEAMQRLRERFLNVALSAVVHPLSRGAAEAAREQQREVEAAPRVTGQELTAGAWFERGYAATDLDEKIRAYSEAIRLKPDLAVAYSNRGNARMGKGDFDGALADYGEAIRLEPNNAVAYNNRGSARCEKGDFDGALPDCDEAIRLKPAYATAHNNRGNARMGKGDLDGALADYGEAIRLEPNYAVAYNNRGNARGEKGDFDGALADCDEAIRLDPRFSVAYRNRGLARSRKGDFDGALADLQQYLDLGRGQHVGDEAQVEAMIRRLKAMPGRGGAGR